VGTVERILNVEEAVSRVTLPSMQENVVSDGKTVVDRC